MTRPVSAGVQSQPVLIRQAAQDPWERQDWESVSRARGGQYRWEQSNLCAPLTGPGHRWLPARGSTPPLPWHPLGTRLSASPGSSSCRDEDGDELQGEAGDSDCLGHRLLPAFPASLLSTVLGNTNQLPTPGAEVGKHVNGGVIFLGATHRSPRGSVLGGS